MAEYLELTEELRLAMNAGARAIENTERYHGASYCRNPFSGNPKEITYLRAAEVLRGTSEGPAADVAPISHSYWEGYSCSRYMGTDEFGEPKWRDGRFFICHNYRCRRKTVVKSAYCPNCGARMDGDPNA